MTATGAGEWAGLPFSRVTALNPKCDRDGSPTEFRPQARYAKAATSVLNPHGAGAFCKFDIPGSFADAGAYVITLDNRPVYVGECTHLARRFNMGYGTISPKNCHIGGQSTNCKVNTKVLNAVKSGAVPALWFHETGDRFRVEELLIIAFDRSARSPWQAVAIRMKRYPPGTARQAPSGPVARFGYLG